MIGKEIWIEMDEDKSATRFSPRKGIIAHIFSEPPEAQTVIFMLHTEAAAKFGMVAVRGRPWLPLQLEAK